jgi:asparagine synthase (glutamine-hydrolysing)
MCGLSGYWQKKGCTEADTLLAMTRRLAPRGPDGEGYWLWDQSNGWGSFFSGADSPPVVADQQPRLMPGLAPTHHLAFGHRRYAIIDPTAGGHQPFHREGMTLAYNGEVYNYQALRDELEDAGYVFQSDSDAEVLLAAYRYWGLDCFVRFRGFFAIALHDASTNRLLLARDSIGKAGLYLLRRQDAWYFASDIKPLLEACPEERGQVRAEAVSDFLYHGLRDHGFGTFWRNISSVPAASWVQLDLNSGAISGGQYWTLPSTRLSSKELPLSEAVATLRQLLAQALERRLVGEKPIGFTLSGGLDSSALVALYAQRECRVQMPVFTVRFADPRYDESNFAKAVVGRYSQYFEHVLLNGLETTLAADLDAFVEIQEEPFHDPALYTDYQQQKLLKKLGIGVNLNGGGGDETLAGYPAYLPNHLRWLGQQPGRGKWREMAADLGSLWQNLPPAVLWAIARKYLFPPKKPLHAGIILLPDTALLPKPNDFSALMLQNMGDRMMHYWMRSHHKNYMQVPMEPRAPYLDIDWVEYCFRLPPDYLIRHGWLKYPLRVAMQGLLPEEICWRTRKMGFPFNTAAWLKEWAPVLQVLLQRDVDNPWIDGPGVAAAYMQLLQRDAQLLWRVVSLSLWHLKMIQGEELVLNK